MKNIFIIILLVFSVVASNAQQSNKQKRKAEKAEKEKQLIEQIQTLIDNKAFVFRARDANPMSGRSIHLDNSYTARIENDSIISYLPFYGRAYSAPYGGTKIPFDFALPIESYTSEKIKKGYLIKVSIDKGTDHLDYTFNISVNGSTTLNVNSTNRQSISFFGAIEEKEKEK
jgi:hypothetical protein